MSRYILFLAKLKERGRPFFKGCKKGGTLWDYPQGHLIVIRNEKVSPFVKLEIILPFLCFSWDPLTNKHCRTCFRGIWCCHTDDALLVSSSWYGFRTNLHGKNSITISAVNAWNKIQTTSGDIILKNSTTTQIKNLLTKKFIE